MASFVSNLLGRLLPKEPAPKPKKGARNDGDKFESAPATARRQRVEPPDQGSAEETMVVGLFKNYTGEPPSKPQLARYAGRARELVAQGVSLSEAYDLVAAELAQDPAFIHDHPFAPFLFTEYRAHLGRIVWPDELKKLEAEIKQTAAQGKNLLEGGAARNGGVRASAEDAQKVRWAAFVNDGYQRLLARPPTPEEMTKVEGMFQRVVKDGGGTEQLAAALNFCIQIGDEYKQKHPFVPFIRETFEHMLKRPPTEKEIADTEGLFRMVAAQGGSLGDLASALKWCIACGDEWKQKHPFNGYIGQLYQEQLGRGPTEAEIDSLEDFIARLSQEGKSLADINAISHYVIALSPEWQARHRPQMNVDRDGIYLQQPNGWSCGPTSLAMAMTAAGLKPHALDSMWEMANALGARDGVGTPGSASLIAEVARRQGASAEYNPSREAGDVRAALQRGHGAVVNGDLGSGAGHFIYLAGLDENGQYIVCDPARPGITRWNDDELNHFTHCGRNPPGFAEIWR